MNNWKVNEKPPENICPRNFCFLWSEDEGQCRSPFGICKRFDAHKSEMDFYEPCEPELQKHNLPWFYFISNPKNLDDDSKSKYIKEASELWGDNEREEKVEIDVSNVRNVYELHSLLKEKLGFPNFYGMNWNAFWDSITGLVEMPKILVLLGWNNIEVNFPDDANIMSNLLEDLNEKYKSWACEVEYR